MTKTDKKAVEPTDFTSAIIAAANGALLPGKFADGMAQVLGIAHAAMKAHEEGRVRYLTPQEKREQKTEASSV